MSLFTFGVVDLDPFVDAWDDGYKGLSYLGLDEDKFENTDVVKCIGGIASVFVKSCGGAKLKGKIIDIVITTFGKGMAADGKKIGENEKKMVLTYQMIRWQCNVLKMLLKKLRKT